jgi:hypothetical protein
MRGARKEVPEMTSATSSISAPVPDTSRGLRNITLYLAAWFAAATAFGASGALPTLPRFFVPVVIWSSFFALLSFYRWGTDVRAALARVPLALPLIFHAIVRTGYGIGIIIEGERGGLPKLFAEVAGPGDVAVGVLALVALGFSTMRTQSARIVLIAWNGLALADIVVALILGQGEIVFGSGPESFAAATRFPFAWLPTFFVPLIVATHVWMFARLRRFE